MSDEVQQELRTAGAGANTVPGTPCAFLSSRIEPLRRQRLAIRAACTDLGVKMWISELDRPELAGKPLADVARACLDMVWTTQMMVLLVEGSYGETASTELGDLSVLELEIALAALSGRPIRAYRLTSKNREHDVRIDGLCGLLERIPDTNIRTAPDNEDSLAAEIANVVAAHFRATAATEAREARLLRRVARSLDPRLTDVERELASPVLRSPFPMVEPLPKSPSTTMRTSELLSEAERLTDVRQQLLTLWSVLRHLAATPWRETYDPVTIDAWLRLLAQWDRSTAWLGTHSATFLSRLAAQRERYEVWRRRRELRPEKTDNELSVGVDGVSASLLYSLAKREASLIARRRLRHRALERVNAALRATTACDISGLLSTRSYTLLRLGHPFRASRDSAKALDLRRAAGENAGRIGEAEATHGWMLAWCLRLREATRLLESGVATLRITNRHGFTVRAMRKLGIFQAFHLRLGLAEQTWRDAQKIALEHEIRDQAVQLERLITRLQRLRSAMDLRSMF